MRKSFCRSQRTSPPIYLHLIFAILQIEIKRSGPIMSNFWGWFFQVKKYCSVRTKKLNKMNLQKIKNKS